MKFEEALAALLEGAKIRHPSMPESEYYIACKMSLIGDNENAFDKFFKSVLNLSLDDWELYGTSEN